MSHCAMCGSSIASQEGRIEGIKNRDGHRRKVKYSELVCDSCSVKLHRFDAFKGFLTLAAVAAVAGLVLLFVKWTFQLVSGL